MYIYIYIYIYIRPAYRDLGVLAARRLAPALTLGLGSVAACRPPPEQNTEPSIKSAQVTAQDDRA